ncbi:MAG: glycoside hydrolase family 9 protein [Oscillospiraceae bacterium]|jgi:hypothetical protein|nr:glycoside hydrolase family 9 protein [Oscillospiraceae bacterium]
MNTEKRTRLGSKIVSAVLAAAMLPSVALFKSNAANTDPTPGTQLQTILVNSTYNPDGIWRTQEWGGENIIPNSNWTTMSIRDYYENGTVNFEVNCLRIITVPGPSSFTIGLKSKKHGVETQINWTEEIAGQPLESGEPYMEWKSFSLPIKDLVDAYPESDFSLDDFWLIAVGGVDDSDVLEFRNVTISSPDDERQYPFIKVNQVGYDTYAEKEARVSNFPKFGTLGGKTYEVVNADTDETVFSGEISSVPLQLDEASGEDIRILNFSEVKTPGEYFIRIPNAGLDPDALSPRDKYEGLDVNTIESVKFTIGENVYGGLLTDLVRYYYFQRQGIDLEEKYAGEFARENLHPNDVTVKKWSDRGNPDAETTDVSQGWYDAGDYGKYINPAAGTLEDLLFAYELNPEVFNSLNLNIPETDPANPRYVNAPGFLSEVKWELDMLLKFEHSSKDGSFYIAANYDGNTIYMEDTLTRETTHTSPETDRDLRSHQATANAAAVLAHAYMVYKDVPAYKDFAEQCLSTAIRAWNWLNNPDNKKNFSIGAANRTYSFTQEDLDRDMFWAAGALYRAIKAAPINMSPAEQEDYIAEHYEDPSVINCFDADMSLSYNHGARSFSGFVHYLYGNDTPNSDVADYFRTEFNTWYTKTTARPDNWGTVYPTWGYWWGANQVIAQSAATMMIGNLILYGENPYERPLPYLEGTMHHLLGVNPLSFSYVSGAGENSVKNIYSDIYSNAKKLDPYKAPPGYFTEGSNHYDNRHLSKYDGKCYLDSDTEYTTNENTIYGNAAMILLVSSVMADQQEPATDVLQLKKQLLGVEINNDPQSSSYDLNDDYVADVFDLALMKSVKTGQHEISAITITSSSFGATMSEDYVDFSNSLYTEYRGDITGKPITTFTGKIPEDKAAEFLTSASPMFNRLNYSYINWNILDGIQWRIAIEYSNGYVKRVYGSNAFPRSWSTMIELFDELTAYAEGIIMPLTTALETEN